MNSDEKLRQLNRLVNDRELSHRSRNIIHSTIQHIKIQDQELLKFKEDITDLQISDKENAKQNAHIAVMAFAPKPWDRFSRS